MSTREQNLGDVVPNIHPLRHVINDALCHVNSLKTLLPPCLLHGAFATVLEVFSGIATRERHKIGFPSLPKELLRCFAYSVTARCMCCRTGVLFGSGRSLEMVRAELPAVSRVAPKDGNDFNSIEKLKR
jgi:hypothetical protein